MKTIFEEYPGIVIYRITNIESGKSYIGSTKNFLSRKRNHLILLRKGKHSNHSLQEDFEKIGREKFLFEILEFVKNRDDLFSRESFWMSKFPILYNIKHAPQTNNRTLRSKLSDRFRDLLVIEVENDPLFIDAIKDKLGISREFAFDLLRYNVFTIGRFALLSGLSVTTVCQKSSPSLINGSIDVELDFCYPFSDSENEGPKFIVRNEKSEKYLKI